MYHAYSFKKHVDKINDLLVQAYRDNYYLTMILKCFHKVNKGFSSAKGKTFSTRIKNKMYLDQLN